MTAKIEDFRTEYLNNMAKFISLELFKERVQENDENEAFSMNILRKLGTNNLLAGPIPQEYGGIGLDPITWGIGCEMIGAASAAVFTSAATIQISLIAETILVWGNELQRIQYIPYLSNGEKIGCFALTEPNGGSDPSTLETTATRVNGGWLINGQKLWIGNGSIADVALVFAQSNPRLPQRTPYPGIAAFLVDTNTPGYSAKPLSGKLGVRSSNISAIELNNCFVPNHALLGDVGQGFQIAMAAVDKGRYSTAACAVGIAQACLDACIDRARTRHQFGQPIGQFQLIQEMIANITVETEAARLLVRNAGAAISSGEDQKQLTLKIAMAKYFAPEVAIKAARNAIQIHGAYGYFSMGHVERYLRDAISLGIYEGTTQLQQLIIGRAMLGIDAFQRNFTPDERPA